VEEEAGMDTALLGAICGLVGTALGAAVAYAGPLRAEQRRQRSEQAVRTENRLTVDLDRYVRARAEADIWLDLLRRAYDDMRVGRLNLDQFDADATRHSEELRLRLADLAHLGVMIVGTLDFFDLLRAATFTLKRAALLPPGDEREHQVRQVEGRIEGCVAARNEWAVGLLDCLGDRAALDRHPRPRP